MTDLPSFTAIAETGTPQQIFAALETWVQQDVGAIIFSGSVFDLAASKSRRIYTNQPAVYPVSGLKDITPNAWTAQVLDARKTFVANTLEEIATVFPDHPIIRSLGCGSVVNMPVFLAGKFLGTLNILHQPGHYTPERVARLHALRVPTTLAFAAFAVLPAFPTVCQPSSVCAVAAGVRTLAPSRPLHPRPHWMHA